ncbi:MAG: hypothetical protein ACRDG4_15195 [Chloroflexota bacterium]
MPIEQHEREDDLKQPATMVGEGVTCNGVDSSAERRAHMRELTMARQEAERRFSRAGIPAGVDRPARLAAARERAEDLRAELARIDGMHRSWLHDKGMHVPERLARQDRPSPHLRPEPPALISPDAPA